MIPIWDPEQDDVLVCRQVRRETDDVSSFVFEAARPCHFAFRPGQFLTFTFMIDGEPHSRCYSIASPPTRPANVVITVKRVPGGPVSNWLHDSMRPGMRVRALGPLGAFTDESDGRKLLLLSAGSGITPLMSMARTHDDLATGADILFIHSARSPADIIFRDEQALLTRHGAGFRSLALCSRDLPGGPWAGVRGRLSAALLAHAVPDLHEREIFVCGPAPYMQAVGAMLAEAGIDPARHHQESFSFDEPGAEGEPPPAPGALAYQVAFSKSQRRLDCPADTTILAAARAAGLRLPASCTRGMCGTCKSRLLSGSVAMQHAGGIRQREIDAGMILICCARPTSDVVVER